MGSAVTSYLARNGHRVSAFDRFTPPHAQGSSHGLSRMFRQSYWEDSRYVPLLLRAQELWAKMGRDAGEPLLHLIGGLVIGREGGQLVARSEGSARQFHLPHEMLSANELKRRYPVLQVEPDTIALLERNAGYLVPEKCIEQELIQAVRGGADLHYNEPVLTWTSETDDWVTVSTSAGTYTAEQLVITPGPWAPQILAELGLPLRVTRQVLYWFAPMGPIDLFRQDHLPVYLFEAGDGEPLVYGFPLTDPASEGVKVAVHGSSELCTPKTICRQIRSEDESYIRQRLADTLPLLAGPLLRAETCLYTMTPDENFIIGSHTDHPAVTIVAGFSGHGFKFAPVIGEIVGEIVATGKSSQDIAMFSPTRFDAA